MNLTGYYLNAKKILTISLINNNNKKHVPLELTRIWIVNFSCRIVKTRIYDP